MPFKFELNLSCVYRYLIKFIIRIYYLLEKNL